MKNPLNKTETRCLQQENHKHYNYRSLNNSTKHYVNNQEYIPLAEASNFIATISKINNWVEAQSKWFNIALMNVFKSPTGCSEKPCLYCS